jgi:alanyl-tRNA synthetase
MQSAEIRRRFLDFFASREHTIVPSASLIPERDPTLFFVNAGMVQFKDIFTGDQTTEMRRATSVQKCLRVSGKHNDLENVGRTARHHTFFEMLGNFSFGDYFKDQACAWAWELLTASESEGGFALDADRLWVSVFEEDDEAYQLWTKVIGVPEARVQRLDAKENFWSMGPTGACGPCTELHWDHGAKYGDDLRGPAGGSDRYVEIWNNVFMEFDQQADGTRTALPRPSIDTGMGLERLAAVKQGVYWNYDTDLFQSIIRRITDLSGRPYGGTMEEPDVALRVIADHARASAFLVADGVMPSNEGRGYVLRRIMRRAIRFGVKLGIKDPFLWHAADTVIDEMGEAYGELEQRRSFIQEVVRGEEERFSRTLDRGLALLEKELQKDVDTLPGKVVFTLHDTYGFPKDLTSLIASERNVGIDLEGYKACMAEQKEKGKKAWGGSGDEKAAQVLVELANELGATSFTGYDADTGNDTVVAIVAEGHRVDRLATGGQAIVIVPSTPFYAESGGQVGDTGRIVFEGGEFSVTEVTKGPGDVFLHHGTVTLGTLTVGAPAELRVEGGRRDLTRLNHTATHLLHAALKQVLGNHVEQKGSLVDPDRLRFDFSHHKPVSASELEAIEDLVYGQILANDSVDTAVQGLEEARAAGAMALFGEKYGDRVRVVSMGGFSTELCGGTHASRTGDIGLFRITSEAGIAAGVRRIEGLTGPGALRYVRQRDAAAMTAAGKLRTRIEELPDALDRMIQDRKSLEKELEALKLELARAAGGDLLDQARDADGFKVLAAELPGDANTLRQEADRLRNQLGPSLVVLASRSEGRVVLVAAVSEDIAGKKAHAGNVVREAAKVVGGGGGGRPNFASAGGKNPDAVPAALARVYELMGV